MKVVHPEHGVGKISKKLFESNSEYIEVAFKEGTIKVKKSECKLQLLS